ncbi:damage-inducible protein DinB [Sneathiella sp. P13V-1]|uniref:DinB family protein n=1 Tax=Sneathiella sp. P13V-1 TaxID=2697366 RepID=UPI00187B1D44|nr:DinB family protein [Sneathiella sp. P13V-1]MBE7635335.1 damage-inducible protein DinB [Sneathiella sp. P13V-1]
MKEHFAILAAYNKWANNLLFEVVLKLNEEEFHRDIKGFFKSVCGTLNHIMVGDLLWMERLQGGGPKPATLDTVLHTNAVDLWKARQETDERLIRLVDTLDPAKYGDILNYKNSRGEVQNTQISHILTHIINHQTHHRGQCHQSLTQLGKEAPSIDLIYYLKSIGKT